MKNILLFVIQSAIIQNTCKNYCLKLTNQIEPIWSNLSSWPCYWIHFTNFTII